MWKKKNIPDLGHFNLNSLTLNAPEVTLVLFLEDEWCVHVRLEAGGHLDDLAVLRPQRLPHGGQQVDVGRAAGAGFSLASDFIRYHKIQADISTGISELTALQLTAQLSVI